VRCNGGPRPALVRIRDRAAPHPGRPARRGGALPALPGSGSARPTAAMADFALWATACEPALWPAGTFASAYRQTAERLSKYHRSGSHSDLRAYNHGRVDRDLLRLCADHSDLSKPTALAKNPRALAGRLRRAQTFLRTLGIEITFSREGRAGTRMINADGILVLVLTLIVRVRRGHRQYRRCCRHY
jgi:hypothetical protein